MKNGKIFFAEVDYIGVTCYQGKLSAALFWPG